MLHITRKIGDKIVINNDIIIEITAISKNKVKISCDFPLDSTVMRKELYDKISQQNIAAQSQHSAALPQSNLLQEHDIILDNITKKPK